jgi:hypothetical protein
MPLRLIALAAVVACLSLPHAAAHAQQLSGHVVDDSTGFAIPDVAIRAYDASGNERAITYSDSAGWFGTRLASGSYRFRLSRLGYVDLETDAVRIGRNEVVALELRMGPSAIPVEPVLVRARTRTARIGAEEFHRRMARQKAIGHGRFITREDIENTSVISINDLMVRDPALMVVPRTLPGGGSIRASTDVLMLRQPGLRHCFPAVFIDGFRIRADQTDLSEFLQPDALEGVEIYPNPLFAPGELADPYGCGSVAFWTKVSGPTRFITMRQLYIVAGVVVGGILLTR